METEPELRGERRAGGADVGLNPPRAQAGAQHCTPAQRSDGVAARAEARAVAGRVRRPAPTGVERPA